MPIGQMRRKIIRPEHRHHAVRLVAQRDFSALKFAGFAAGALVIGLHRQFDLGDHRVYFVGRIPGDFTRIAAQRFNEKNGDFVNKLYGCVTTGNLWKFIKLEEQTVTIGLREYSLPPVAEILGILVSFII